MAKRHRTPEGYARQLAYAKKWHAKNREQIAQREQQRRHERRLTALQAYGGNPPACSRCGNTQVDHLLLVGEHVDSRKRGGTEQYRYLEKLGYPSGFHVLCWNCKMAGTYYGISTPESNTVSRILHSERQEDRSSA